MENFTETMKNLFLEVADMENRENFTTRLARAMRVRDMTQKELADRTGFSKSRISQYVNGKYEAKQDGVYKLSRALDVNEAWLMGYDCAMDRRPPADEAPEEPKKSDLSRLNEYFGNMSEEGRALLLKLAEALYHDYGAPAAQGDTGPILPAAPWGRRVL